MSRYAYDKQTKQSTLIAGGQPPITIAGTESTSTASKAYTVGQYLVYNSFLCRVISAIAQGDTLAIGTNISATTVGDEISNHLTVNGTEFYFDTHDGEFGYNTSPNRGADTFHPFKQTPDTYTEYIYAYAYQGSGNFFRSYGRDLFKLFKYVTVYITQQGGTYGPRVGYSFSNTDGASGATVSVSSGTKYTLDWSYKYFNFCIYPYDCKNSYGTSVTLVFSN